ncbi:lipoyl(octanoyl) transferase LipB [Liberibacter crescens]|nr:lipoyl(octanoyl) transferase LipB [Liberibacter crescens]
MLPAKHQAPVRWRVTNYLVPYEEAIQTMENEVKSISSGHASELVWLLEHPPLYTAGTSAHSNELISPDRFPVYYTGRGGGYTYHGPGQRVVYVMLNLNNRRKDIRCFIAALEEVIIQVLSTMNIHGERREDRIGVWIRRPEKPILMNGLPAEDKIASIGIRIRHWVSFHGFSLNVSPNLNHFSGIIPCGIQLYGVTSLTDLGQTQPIENIDLEIQKIFETIFGPTTMIE